MYLKMQLVQRCKLSLSPL